MRIGAAGGRDLIVGEGTTRLMGVVNVTPDSFYDGGRYRDVELAVDHGRRLCEAGADVLDVGGESTRPGHAPVDDAEQIRRVVPVVEALVNAVRVPISIDTTRAEVARRALEAGAHWVNDTLALLGDGRMAEVIAAAGCPVVLMHRFVPPRARQAASTGRPVVEAIAAALRERVEVAQRSGIASGRILLDPGIGFGTLPEDNLAIHAHIEPMRELGFPLVYGPSRKSFLGRILGGSRGPAELLLATAASVTALALRGVEILRVHDVAEMRDAVRVADALRNGACEWM
jgi:dihydropteroate synthase